MAKNIQTKPCKKVDTKDPIDGSINGWLLEIISDKDRFTKHLKGQVYLTTLDPGVVKGYHIHAGADYFVTCLRGNLKSTVYLSKNKKEEFESGEGNFLTYRLPKGSAHLLENVGDEPVYVLVYRYPVWSPNFPEQLDIDPKDIELDSTWDKIKKFVEEFK